MIATGSEDTPRHPIQVVARRSGLSADVLRVWEKRYGAVRPSRTNTSRRLYSDADLERILLLRRATLGGRRIGEVANLSDAELRALVAADDAAAAPAPPRHVGKVTEGAAEFLAETVEAAKDYDGPRLEAALSRAAVSLSASALLESVVVPLMHAVGTEWRAGTMGIAQEHLATSLARTVLGRVRASLRPARDAPVLIATTPSGQLHEIGALMAAVAAAAEGWGAIYLGPNLPAAEIAAAAERRRARAIALSIVHDGDDPALWQELRGLGERVDAAATAILVGGQGSAACGAVLREIGARRMETLEHFRSELRTLGGRRRARR